MHRGWFAAVVLGVAGIAAADVRPDPEVVATATTVNLPAPAFRWPKLAGNLHSVLELRVGGHGLLNSKIAVRGYVVYVYNCVAELREPGQTVAQVQAKVDDDPTLCFRPKLYLSDRPDGRISDGLWVVDVPRPPNKLERERLPHDELAHWPAVPKVAVGDYVEVTGDFEVSSGHDMSSLGLVSYASLAHVTPPARVDVTAPPPDAQRPAPAVPAARSVAAPTEAARRLSIEHANDGNKALAVKQLDIAIDAFTKATAAWPDNALAWYGLGVAHAERASWADASVAFERAAAIAPDAAMYQMWAGIAGYELVRAAQRAQQAHLAAGAAPAPPDAHALDVAEDHLAIALAVEPGLWRAHYYVGKIERDRQHWQLAGDAFGDAIRRDPRETGPYVALAVLYNAWELPDAALAVTAAGTANAAPGDGLADIWYERGVALDAKGKLADAIDAYTHAVAVRSNFPAALFERGRDRFKQRDYQHAGADLRAYLQGATDTEQAGLSRIMLAQIHG